MERKNNGRGIFYGVIGVATLVVAIIGATFAYFTATRGNNNVITGNMATIEFGLSVTKVTTVDETKGGMIPMSNNMVKNAVENASTKGICVDDNDNAVCQIYKITVNNTGSASLFVDGYVVLDGGSGTPTDATYTSSSTYTTMRWAQAFCEGSGDTVTSCSTTGSSQINSDAAATVTDIAHPTAAAQAHNPDALLTSGNTGTATIAGNSYEYIDKNYIRYSDHATGPFDRIDDVESALVYNQYLTPSTGSSASSDMYIVVWLSENGHNQTVGATDAATSALNFFHGTVTFSSAQGSEVTATFSSYAAVPSDNASGN